MTNVVIADTSCLIAFSNIGRLSLLEDTYGPIFVTPQVKKEFGKALPDWIQVRAVASQADIERFSQKVDIGEASSIALAIELGDALLIVDDLDARKLASELHLLITGTLGTLIRAKRKGLIPSIKPVLEELKQDGFWISEALEKIALRKAGE